MKINSINSNNLQSPLVSFKRKASDIHESSHVGKSFSYNPRVLATALALATISPSCTQKSTVDELCSAITTNQNDGVKDILKQLGKDFGVKNLNYEKINDNKYSINFEMDKAKADCILKVSDSKDSCSGFILLSEKNVLRPSTDQYYYEARIDNTDNSIDISYQKLGAEEKQKLKIKN